MLEVIGLIAVVLIVSFLLGALFTDRLYVQIIWSAVGFFGIAVGFDYWLLWWCLAMGGSLGIILMALNPSLRKR